MASLILIILLGLLAATAALTGFRTGLVKQLGALAGLVISTIVCRIAGDKVAESFAAGAATPEEQLAATVLAYVVLFLIVFLVVYLISMLLRTVISALFLGGIDRAAGAVFRVVLWGILLCVGLNLLNALMPHMPLADNPIMQKLLSIGMTVMGSDTYALIRDAGSSLPM